MNVKLEAAGHVDCPVHGCQVAVDYFGRPLERCAGCAREAEAGERVLRARIARRHIAAIGERFAPVNPQSRAKG